MSETQDAGTGGGQLDSAGAADAPDYSRDESAGIDPDATGDGTSEAASGDTAADETAAGPAEEADPGDDGPVSTGAVE